MQEGYVWIFLMSKLFFTYTIYRFMRVFFEPKEGNRWQEWVSYGLYFIVVSMIFLINNRLIVNVVSNLVAFYLLTLNYKASLKQRLLTSVLIYAILASVELIITILTGYWIFEFFQVNIRYQSAYGLIIMKILSFIIVLIFENSKSLKQGDHISLPYWLAIFLIPIGSLYTIYVLLQTTEIQPVAVNICIFVAFISNVWVFYLYQGLNASFAQRTEQALLAQQNQYYKNQLAVMNEGYETVKNTRHDFKNHCIAFASYLKQGDKVHGLKYLEQIVQQTYADSEFVATGNQTIDSLVNFKLQQATAQKITVTTDITIPKQLAIDPFDLVTILGNILDNAITAAANCDDERQLDLAINVDAGRLIIVLRNTYSGSLKVENQQLLTTKADETNHGLGLANVRKAVEKYHGTVDVTYHEPSFQVWISLYLPQAESE